jgi:methyltransferase-like protein/2-polyprenyl-3-methyl-5-hydroxy-6-metoxy-1,4-benzoquinol methylase
LAAVDQRTARGYDWRVSAPLTAYDEVRYTSGPFPQTHPDRLATLATWFGMQPAPVDRCRVLELGCGTGANLIPMALGLPESSFVGVDLASTAITDGQALATALGLDNIDLRTLDLREIPDDLGTFDYIIAHGLFSWVPHDVQEQVLALCAAHLAPMGVAYVSYNANPGCHVRTMLREMMLYHVRTISDPRQRIAQALDFAQFLGAALPDADYSAFLRVELEELFEWRREYVFHDDLAPHNEPLYFSEFMDRAERFELQYLAEANIFDMQDYGFPPAVREYLRTVEARRGFLEKEQYLDFVKNRRFRQTVLCHAQTKLEREVAPAAVRQFLISSQATPESKTPDVSSRSVEVFNGPKGASMRTDEPLAKAAVVCLGQAWPRRVKLDELMSQAQVLSDSPCAPDDERALLEILQQAYLAGVVELHVHGPRMATSANQWPEASRLARLQARDGSLVTTLLHTTVLLEDEMARYALQLMDGSRDRDELAERLDEWTSSQRIPVQPSRAHLDEKLCKLAALGLLVA